MENQKLQNFLTKVVMLLMLSIAGNAAFAQRISASGGTYTIDSTGTNTGSNFINFTSAITDLNSVGTITGNIVFNVVAGQTFTENTPAITNSGSATATVVFQKSGVGNNPVIYPIGSGGSTDFGISIKGADYITFNGIDIDSKGNTAVEFGYLIVNSSSTNGAWFNTITNCTILLARNINTTRAIMQSANASYGGATTATALTGINKGNTYSNLTVGSTNSAVYMYGASSTYRDSGNVVTNNTFGRSSVPQDIGGNLANIVYINYMFYQNYSSITNNTITNVANLSSMYIIYGSQCIGDTIRNNTVSNIQSTSTTYLIYMPTNQDLTISNNEFTNCSTTGSLYMAYASTGPNVTISNNSYSNISSGTTYGIYTSSVVNNQVFNNTITNVTSAGTVYINYFLSATKVNQYNNKFNNITTSNGTVYGFYASSIRGDSTLLTDNNIYNNEWDYIGYTGTSSSYTVYGLFVTNLTTQNVDVKINNNKWNRLFNNYAPSSPTASRYLYGMFFSTTANTTVSTVANYDIYYNTLQIDQGTGIDYSSATMYFAPTTNTALVPVYKIKNNHFANLTGSQTGVAKHYVLLSQSSGGNYLGNALSECNNNNYYLPNTTNGYMGYANATDIATLTAWQTAFPSFDANSLSANPVFNSPTVVRPLWSSPLVAAGTPITGITTDILGTTRSVSTPTIGAYESAGDALAPSVTYTPLLNAYSLSNRTTTNFATITDNFQVNVSSGQAPRIYYKKTSNANAFGTNDSTFNGWKWVETSSSVNPFNFTIDYSLLTSSVIVGDTIQYFVVAQDTSNNVTSNPSNGFVGTSVSSITAAPTPNTYIVVASSPAAPVVNGVAAINIAGYSATVGGNITSDGGSTITSSGVVYSTNPNPALLGLGVVDSTTSPVVGAGIFNFNLGGLLPGTKYYFRAYAINSIGTSYSSQDSFTTDPVISYFPYAENFDTTGKNTGWTSSIVTGGVNDWVVGTPAKTYLSGAHSGTKAWVTGLTGNYTAGQDAAVISPQMDFSSAIATPLLRFQHKFKSEVGWDAMVVEISINNGAWTKLDNNLGIGGNYNTTNSVGWYNNTSVSGPIAPNKFSANTSASTYSSQVSGWVQSLTPLVGASGQSNVRVRFRFGCDASVVDEGWALDDIEVFLPAAPTVSTGTKSFVTMSGATLAGTVVNDGGNTVTASGVVVGTSSNPTIGGFGVIDSATNPTVASGGYSVSVTGLTASTTYHYRAYAINGVGTSYGPDSTFTTASSPMTYLSSTTTQNATSKVGQGTSNNEVVGIRVIMSSSGASVYATQFDFNANGTTDTSNIRNLKVWYTGASSTFAANTLVGSISSLPGIMGTNFSITGSQPMLNDTNYFWLTYDITPGATIGNFIDAECSSITINSFPQTPSVTAPVGNRQIRASYCASSANYTGDEEIINVTFGSLNNSSTCTTTGGATGTLVSTPSILERYSNFTNLTAPNIIRGTNQNLSVKVDVCGSYYGANLRAFIDWNQNGIFEVTEVVTFSAPVSGTNEVLTASVSIPCDAVLGNTLLRVVYQEGGVPVACGTYGWGETEDYAINIVDNPAVYVSSTAIQQTGTSSPGALDQKILRIPVKTTGCGLALATSFNFNTSGTTSAGDITSAKLYATGNSPVFNTTKLVGTSVSPSGVFIFTTLDTLVSNDTTNYWLAYDVSSGATLTNVLDARLDSMEILGAYRIPTDSAPAGNIVINSPMTFVSTTATQNDTTKVGQGTASNVVIGMKVVMSATGSPVNLTQFNLDANGTTDTSNIRNLKVWYTGATNAFSMGTQFGSTVSVLPGTTSFTVTGLQALLNGDNYFWLSYDVTPTATIGNSIDAEFTSAIIASATQFPLVTSPVGSRQIRASYCASSANYTGDEEIINVTFGSLNNSSTCTTTGGATGTLVSTPSILERYSNYTNLAAPSLLRANTYPLSVKVNTCGSYYGATLRAFIDWNQNGLFDVTEVVTFSAPVSGLNEVITSYVTVPCDAVLGNTLLRVVYQESGTPVPCGTYGWGETEDYVINIGSNPVVYTSSTAIQQTGTSSPGALDQKILRIPVKTTGCGLALATSFNFNTAGSTSASDIATAKLYSTGNSPVFNTTKLVGTSVSPSGVFVFTTSDTLVSNDTTNYWLAYDVSSGATLTNVLDARLDSMEILGSYRLPTVSAPAGNIVINSPMTFVSATATQNDTTKVGQGTPNNVVMGMKIVMSASGSPVNLTQFNLDANGTTDTSNIRNLKVWYTGATNAFSMGSQFGSTISVLPGTTSFTVTGLQTLLNGDNYFWLSYDITPTATIGNYVDAEFTSAVIASVTQFPLTSAPVGKRQIRADFCIPTYTNGSAFDHLTNVTLGTINNNSGASLDYIYYNNLSTNLYAGGSYNLTGTIYNGGTEMVAAWIDYNNDGIFSAAEKLGEYTGLTFTIPFTVALNATPGMYRLRVRNVYNTINIDPCINYSYGETEDYNVVILPAPYNTYTWNQTSPASFEIDANWTPSRTNINLSDKLQFNGGGSVVVNSVPTQQVSQIIVANNSTVTLNNTILSVLTVKDTLALTSGKIKVGANAVLTVGADTNNVGTITGTGNVEGKLRRWINRVVTSYAFPLAVDSSTRKATVSYSTIPDVSGYLTVNFIPGLPSATGLPLVDGLLNLANISDAGIWNAEANTTLSGGVYDITTDAANLNGVTNYQQTSLVVRATPSSSWSLLGSRVATSGSNSLMTLGRTGLYGGYGQVGIAGTSVNPLPVKTVDLVAVNVNNDVVVKWATLAEFNSKGFEVERSVDGKNFEFVTFVEGKGNSNSRVNYSILDAKAFDIHNAQVLYYRLKQVDLNGKFEYTNTVQVKKSEVPVQSAISVYPNPSNGIVNMSIESAITGVATVIITDMNGKEIAVGNVNVNKGSNGYQLSELKSVANGIYFVKVQLNGESKVTRISIVN